MCTDSTAIISASVELWLTAACPFDAATMGAEVLGPTEATDAPVVDLEAQGVPAKSKSLKSKYRQCEMGSPMWLIKFATNVDSL